MEARELRIGNYLNHKQYGKVILEKEDFVNWDFSEVEPIPLTEEIIKSCEGIIDNGLSGCEFDLGAGSALWFLDPQWYITNPDAVNSSMATDVKVPYVHSLQNLYFALTNTELQFKTLG